MKNLLVLCTALSTTLGAFSAAAATTKQWEVDYSGKPPYKRKLVEMDVVDAAQLEKAETAVVRSTDFSGKPPFKRNVEKLEVVDVAVLEEAGTKPTRTGRPPFKRH